MKSGFVSLVGRPNAGKSTLLNALVGAKVAIVSDKPQTTRNRITGVKNVPGVGQIVFVDTPGIHRPLHRMNVRMVDSAIDTIREVDVLAFVVDASAKPGKGDRFVLDVVKKARIPVVLVLNKIDLVAKPRLLPLIESYRRELDFKAIVPVSALSGDGVDVLEQALIANLPEGESLYPDDYLTDQPERVIAAEIVREKLLAHTRDELPFTTAVVVDRFEEGLKILKLFVTILVEQESHKPIVLGRRGEMIKRIGTEARQELERMFETKVFLDLHVKVKADWRDNERVLDDLGM
ncbi:MAG TPA: GTPase Era [Vicinamibacterales bacterium]|nr:GTPase Era [Vicinamibacterales bacterium]